MKRLTRSNEKIIAGVLSGISNYLNPEWDPIFVRIAFIWAAFFNPALILIYFGLVFIMPVEKLKLRNSHAT
jgi:phage shock protein PspC (stress-responsive transcriptional regulator)